jgi:multidrug resistance efflux pump
MTGAAPIGAIPAGGALPPVQVREPMSVAWQGIEYPVESWNVHGFRLARPIPRILAPGTGRVAEVTLLIGPRGTRIEMQVQVRAIDTDNPQPLEFRFIDLDRAQAEVLHRLVDHAINRQAVSLTRLLNETEAQRQARLETSARSREARKWLQLVLAGAAVAVAVGTVWTRYTSVAARYAAVTAAASTIAPAGPGLVGAIAVTVGQRVAPGEVIAHVRGADHDRRLHAMTDERLALEAQRAELLAREAALVALRGATGGPAGADGAALAETLRVAERRLALERERLAALRATGLPTARRQAERAEQEARVLAAEQAVASARQALAQAAQQQALLQAGVVPGLGLAGLGGLEGTQARLAQLDGLIASARAREELARLGDPVLATCACTVARIERRPGEYTDPTRPIAVLVEDGPPTIHALILGEQARSLQVGDAAAIRLADGRRLGGRVARLDYAAHWPGFVGLQDNVFAADRYARVEIRPDAPLAAPVGMTADVRLSTDRWIAPLMRPLAALVGL